MFLLILVECQLGALGDSNIRGQNIKVTGEFHKNPTELDRLVPSSLLLLPYLFSLLSTGKRVTSSSDLDCYTQHSLNIQVFALFKSISIIIIMTYIGPEGLTSVPKLNHWLSFVIINHFQTKYSRKSMITYISSVMDRIFFNNILHPFQITSLMTITHTKIISLISMYQLQYQIEEARQEQQQRDQENPYPC